MNLTSEILTKLDVSQELFGQIREASNNLSKNPLKDAQIINSKLELVNYQLNSLSDAIKKNSNNVPEGSYEETLLILATSLRESFYSLVSLHETALKYAYARLEKNIEDEMKFNSEIDKYSNEYIINLNSFFI